MLTLVPLLVLQRKQAALSSFTGMFDQDVKQMCAGRCVQSHGMHACFAEAIGCVEDYSMLSSRSE